MQSLFDTSATMKRVTAAMCFVGLGLSATPAIAATKITLLYTAVNAFVGSFVAEDQGFFAERGLDVDLSLAQNGSVISAALVADSAQIGGPTPTVLLQANEQGLDLVVVAGTDFYPQSVSSGVLARSGSGIAGAPGLVGHKVGVPGIGGIIDVLTRKWVQSSGADYRKVDWVELQFPQMGDALKADLVDAVASVDPFYTRIVDSKAGYPIGTYAAIIPNGTIPVVYASTRAWAVKNPEAVRNFRAALDDATAYVADKAHLASVRDSIAKYTKLPPQVAATLRLPDNLDAHATAAGLRFWIGVSREQGLIKGNPDPASLVLP